MKNMQLLHWVANCPFTYSAWMFCTQCSGSALRLERLPRGYWSVSHPLLHFCCWMRSGNEVECCAVTSATHVLVSSQVSINLADKYQHCKLQWGISQFLVLCLNPPCIGLDVHVFIHWVALLESVRHKLILWKMLWSKVYFFHKVQSWRWLNLNN